MLKKPVAAAVRRAINALGYKLERTNTEPHYLKRNSRYAEILKVVEPFTMATLESIAALIDAVEYVNRNQIPGAVVECGVWRGGFMMAAAKALMNANDLRDLFLFDTFRGMTEPTDRDIDHTGSLAIPRHKSSIKGDHSEWCYASFTDVRRNIASTGYPEERSRFIEGDVLQTLPCDEPRQIAILHLDTDWYESTLHELRHLYPKVVKGGIVILDDYGHWQGCRQAVDEYFADQGPYLCPLEYSARLIVKTV